MIELDTGNRPSDHFRKATDRLGTELGDGVLGDAEVLPDSIQVVGAGQSDADSPSAAVLFSIRERLEQHPHFRGRASLFTIELVEQVIVLSGRLPSHYLKQLLQEAIRKVTGVVDIDNQVDVLWPTS